MNLSTELSRAHWRKARRSSSTGSDCVELAAVHGHVAVRDSKDPGRPVLFFERKALRQLAERVNRGEFDL